MNPNFEKYQLSYIRAVPLKEFRSNSRKRGRKVKKHPIFNITSARRINLCKGREGRGEGWERKSGGADMWAMRMG